MAAGSQRQATLQAFLFDFVGYSSGSAATRSWPSRTGSRKNLPTTS